MTKNRKEELKQLLLEAEPSINVQYITQPTGLVPPLPRNIAEYKMLLQQDYISPDNYSIVSECVPYLASNNIRRKMLDFLSREFSEFLNEQQIVMYHTPSGDDSTNLDWMLRKLLKIFLTFGVEKAVQVVDRYTKDNRARYQMVVCIDGITFGRQPLPKNIYPDTPRTWERPAERQVFPGVRLVSVHGSVSSLPRHLRNLYSPVYNSDFINEIDFGEKVLMIIDYSISPLLVPQGKDVTQICQVNNQNFPQLNAEFRGVKPYEVGDLEGRLNWSSTLLKFVEDFCSVLSLHYNCAIRQSYYFDLIPDDELYGILFNDVRSINFANKNTNIRGGKNIDSLDIKEVTRIYSLLVSLDKDVYEKIHTSLMMWIDSYTNQQEITKISILRNAFDALYGFSSKRSNLPNFGKKAARFLDDSTRSKSYQKLYDKTSHIMHGRVTEKELSDLPKFIEDSQDICRRTIMNMIENRELP